MNAEIPAPDQSDETWLRWFESFERLLQPLQKLADELQNTADAIR